MSHAGELSRLHSSHLPHHEQFDSTPVEGRVSRFDQQPHLWHQMLNAEHHEHKLDNKTQTLANAKETMEKREQWSADWVVNYAEAANSGTMKSEFIFGKHIPNPDDKDSPLSILNQFAK